MWTVEVILFYFDIGTYHGISYEDDETLLIIDLDKKVQMGKVRPLLRKHRPVMEDFRANISAYKKATLCNSCVA